MELVLEELLKRNLFLKRNFERNFVKVFFYRFEICEKVLYEAEFCERPSKLT